ncbi:MAG: SDR family oxidoreductase [Burkholderiales bacterium]|nr:SDR family oxidoreductase [Anaerolineae bacterium]
MLNSFMLTGRRALVTGGGGGIGRALSSALYDMGADVLIVGRSQSADEAAAEIGTPERPVQSLQADLNDRQALAAVFEQAVSKLGGLDILVNCHGVVHSQESLTYPIELWDETLENNLNSVFLLCQLAGRVMVPQGSGKIINIASMLSFSGGLRAPAYAAAKGGVAQMTKALANEWSSKGVNVNAIAPGYVKTQLNRHIWTDPVRTEQIMARLPAGRWGDPDDLKGTVVFLASAASDYVHGAIIPVDGGWLSR